MRIDRSPSSEAAERAEPLLTPIERPEPAEAARRTQAHDWSWWPSWARGQLPRVWLWHRGNVGYIEPPARDLLASFLRADRIA